MGILDKIFGKKNEAASMATVAPAQPHRTISYDSALVGSLKHDHGELIALYQRIGNLLQMGHFEELRGELVNFKTRFEAHILTENVRFYTYLEQSMAGDAHNMSLLHDFRREMNTIARGAINFIKKYHAPGALQDGMLAEFSHDYQTVGKLLTQRIEREESSLYPLYQLS